MRLSPRRLPLKATDVIIHLPHMIQTTKFATHDTTHYIKAIANHPELKRNYPANAGSSHIATTLTSLSWSQTYSSLKSSLWAALLSDRPLDIPIILSFSAQASLHCLWIFKSIFTWYGTRQFCHIKKTFWSTVACLSGPWRIAYTWLTPQLHLCTLLHCQDERCYIATPLHCYKMRRPPSLTPGHQLLHLI